MRKNPTLNRIPDPQEARVAINDWASRRGRGIREYRAWECLGQAPRTGHYLFLHRHHRVVMLLTPEGREVEQHKSLAEVAMLLVRLLEGGPTR